MSVDDLAQEEEEEREPRDPKERKRQRDRDRRARLKEAATTAAEKGVSIPPEVAQAMMRGYALLISPGELSQEARQEALRCAMVQGGWMVQRYAGEIPEKWAPAVVGVSGIVTATGVVIRGTVEDKAREQRQKAGLDSPPKAPSGHPAP